LIFDHCLVIPLRDTNMLKPQDLA